jgi:phage gpG-like protein
VRLELDVFGDKQVARELLRLGDRAADARPAWNAIIDRLLLLEREQFDSEGGRASGGWKPLAPSTVADKARRDLDPRILHATGRLRDSLTRRTGGDAVRESHPNEMRFGTDVPYARYHQQGTGRMPRRREIELTETDRHQMFVQVLQRFLVTGETPSIL